MTKISVIIPLHYGLNHVKECLESVKRQSYPSIETLLVVDVDDNYFPKIQEVIDASGINARVIRIPPATMGKARQVGADNATGDILAFIDSDVVLSADYWMMAMVYPFKNPEINLTFCPQTVPREYPNPLTRYIMLSYPFYEGMVVGGGALLVRKSAFPGSPDLRGCEDTIWIKKVNKRVFVKIPAYHYQSETLRQLIKKQWKITVLCTKNNQYSDFGKMPCKSMTLWRMKHFRRALVGKDDPAWLWYPIVGMISMFINPIARRKAERSKKEKKNGVLTTRTGI